MKILLMGLLLSTISFNLQAQSNSEYTDQYSGGHHTGLQHLPRKDGVTGKITGRGTLFLDHEGRALIGKITDRGYKFLDHKGNDITSKISARNGKFLDHNGKELTPKVNVRGDHFLPQGRNRGTRNMHSEYMDEYDQTFQK